MQAGDMPAVQKYYNDPIFLHTVSAKMGGVTREVKAAMRNIPKTGKADDTDGGQNLVEAGISPDTKYAPGISTLHYAGDTDEVMALDETMKYNKNTPDTFRIWDNDPQLTTAFRELQAGDMPATQTYYNDYALLHAVSAKMGNVP